MVNYMEICKWQIQNDCVLAKTYGCEQAEDICDYAAI